ncbi:hypothetical protein BT63DRAFT_24523 [Microthyrium microscopicum]|uniref:PWWP domain-containing protein n=1 Tax=Microthyrium microscopicum TaxID=703497 RepID=A0A6A6UVE6_9PEZI|nr:hypothetical protein BT63DRAFT_24523 [Microthyrium microscopicum]
MADDAASPVAQAVADKAVESPKDVSLNDAPEADEAPAAPPSAENGKLTEDTAAATEQPTSADVDETVADASEAPVAANGDAAPTPASKKNSKRKSVSTPAKKLNKKKSMPNLHLDVKPGEYWYVQMKGYPAWPAIVCDEEMLPASLLKYRPVSTMRLDGTYREDFEEGGKNVRDRRYPVMFLGTNEFAWQVNTDLVPLDIDELKAIVERNEVGKKTKALWSAYEVAAEGHDLEYFKTMLKEHELHLQQEQERAIEEVEDKKAKKEKKGKKDDDGDIEMDDAEEEVTDKKKSAKKRKKSLGDGVEESGKKTKIVLKGLKSTGDDDQPKPKKAKKAKVTESEEPEAKATPQAPMTKEERLQKREKTIYYLRHRLQKGLVNKEKKPSEDDMDIMAEHLRTLESFPDLEASIIRQTKINKLLKAVIKVPDLPRDEEFQFKDRCHKLLATWTESLNADEDKTPAVENGVTNGKSEEPADAEAAAEKPKESVPNGKEASAEPKTEAKIDKKAEAASEEPAPASDAMDIDKDEPAKAEVTAED